MVSAARILRLPLFLLLSFSSCRIQFIGDGRVTSVFVTPANPTIAVGGTQQFTAHVTHKDGFTTQTTAALWSTSNPTIAKISSSGLATGINPGTASITATVDAVSGSTSLTVKPTATANVVVQGGPGKLEVAFPMSGLRFLYVPNALEDTVAIYRLDAGPDEERFVGAVSVSPGRGPVWVAVHPLGKYLYVLNQLSHNISAFLIDQTTGGLQAVAGSPFPCPGEPRTIAVDAAGEFVEVTDNKSSRLARFRIDQFTGALAPWAESS